MKTSTIFRILSAIFIVFLTLASAFPAYAEEPITSKVVLDSWYTKDGICSFPIEVHETGLLMEKQWYDENSNLVREMYTFGGNIYYLYANDKTVTVHNSGTTKINYISPQETVVTISGQEWAWMIPGLGMVSGEIGKQTTSYIYDGGDLVEVIVQKLVGKIMWTDVTPLLCEYLK